VISLLVNEFWYEAIGVFVSIPLAPMNLFSFWYEKFEVAKELVSNMLQRLDFFLNLGIGFDRMWLDFSDELLHRSDFQGVRN
jgi:hypothetical protein